MSLHRPVEWRLPAVILPWPQIMQFGTAFIRGTRFEMGSVRSGGARPDAYTTVVWTSSNSLG